MSFPETLPLNSLTILSVHLIFGAPCFLDNGFSDINHGKSDVVRKSPSYVSLQSQPTLLELISDIVRTGTATNVFVADLSSFFIPHIY